MSQPREPPLPKTGKEFITFRVIPVQASIQEEEHTCVICSLEYGTTNPDDPSHLPERAVKVKKCGHIFGQRCLMKHVSGKRISNQQCPICRDRLFVAEVDDELEDDIDELEELLRQLHELMAVYVEQSESEGLQEEQYDDIKAEMARTQTLIDEAEQALKDARD